jgi:anti-sigma28 factor (negative regulator of flagellin synthesis)
MKINGGNNGPIRPDATNRDDRISVPNSTDASGKAGARVDTVEISDAGRAKAAETAASPEARSARLQDIRERILRGAYDTDEVVAEVARRILDRGHLEPSLSADSQ